MDQGCIKRLTNEKWIKRKYIWEWILLSASTMHAKKKAVRNKCAVACLFYAYLSSVRRTDWAINRHKLSRTDLNMFSTIMIKI